MKIALIDNTTVLQVWPLADGQTEIDVRHTLPDGKQVSPIVAGWSSGAYAVVAVTEFVPPQGKRRIGAPSYAVVNGAVVETYEVADTDPPPRPTVRKTTVQARLIEAGLMDEAYAALTSNAVYFARWFAPGHVSVYCDDPDAIALLIAIGGDPETILAAD